MAATHVEGGLSDLLGRNVLLSLVHMLGVIYLKLTLED